MSDKVVILVENDLFKLEDMLLSIQSILFVATKQKLENAPGQGDTEICVLHLIDNNEKADRKSFDRFVSKLEDRQRELMVYDYKCELKYKYETVCIDMASYPPDDWEKDMEDVCKKISEITDEHDYAIVLDLILNDDKDPDLVLKGDQILSQYLYKKYKEHCIPYTTYKIFEQEFRKKWAEGVGTDQMPYERYCLDGNVIHKGFKKEIYGHLKIGI